LGINALINYAHSGSLATITRYHTAYHTLVSRGLANWPRSAIIRHLEMYSLRSARCRIAASAFIDKVTQADFPGIPKAEAVIPLASEPALAANRALPRERLIIFVGRMMPGHKNPDMAARAFAELAGIFPAWRIEFAGMDIRIGETETMWQRCEMILAPWKGRYAYHGVLSREQVNALYRRARIMVIPSKFESFGLVAQEGMAAGCVPLVADDTALAEVVGEAGVIFINGSQTDLNTKLHDLLSDESVLKERSESCMRRVKDQYSPERITRMNLGVFARATRAAAGSAG
jgi:glycosyltransferase involved in cell wall biosynthesis